MKPVLFAQKQAQFVVISRRAHSDHHHFFNDQTIIIANSIKQIEQETWFRPIWLGNKSQLSIKITTDRLSSKAGSFLSIFFSSSRFNEFNGLFYVWFGCLLCLQFTLMVFLPSEQHKQHTLFAFVLVNFIIDIGIADTQKKYNIFHEKEKIK